MVVTLKIVDVWGYGPETRGAISALFGLGGLAGVVIGGQLSRTEKEMVAAVAAAAQDCHY
jgi:predicted MFS family arabinose efflux permease